MSGFDISSAHFPATDNLPDNITLGTLDSFIDTIPEAMIGKFDIVHVRAFAAVVKNDNPGPLITNALKMLKPGGYFQWDEIDSDSLRAVPPNLSISAISTQDMLDTAVLSSKNAMNLNYQWCSNLGSILRHYGLDVIADTRMEVKKELRKPTTDSILMAFEHIAKIAVRDGCMVGTNKNWANLWNNSRPEIDNGVTQLYPMNNMVIDSPSPLPSLGTYADSTYTAFDPIFLSYHSNMD